MQGSITLATTDTASFARKLLKIPYGVIIWRTAEVYNTGDEARVTLHFDWAVDLA